MLIKRHSQNPAKKRWQLSCQKSNVCPAPNYYGKILPACSSYGDPDAVLNGSKDKKEGAETTKRHRNAATRLKEKLDRIRALYGLNRMQKESIAERKNARPESVKALKELYDRDISNNAWMDGAEYGDGSCRLEKMAKSSQRGENRFKNVVGTMHAKIMHLTALSLGRPFRVKAETFFGETMELVFPDIVSDYIFQDGFFEKELTTMLLKYLKPGMVFFDIGAHFGYFSLLASNLVGCGGRVCSFEPTKSSFSVLERNMDGKTNVRLENLAIYSENATIAFNDYGIGFSAFNSLYEPRLDNTLRKKIRLRSYKVDAIPIDDYVEKTGIRPDFIKIDAESSEYFIIQGMMGVMAKFRPIITIEVGDKDIEGIISSRELITHVVENGYAPFEFRDGRIVRHRINERYGYDNILFLPE